jgi:hypothetical protein
MRTPRRPNIWFVLLLSLCATPPLLFPAKAAQSDTAQAKPDASDQEKRQEAVTLFSQGKRLDALPLLEELVQMNPRDAERAMRLDPDIETAFRYYADMLAKQGDMVKARSMLIHAAVAEPYNKIVWREIRAWALINNTAFNVVYLPIPLVAKDDGSIQVSGQPPELLSAWRAYHAVIADWRKGGRFEKQFPKEAYRHSLAEESEALTAAAVVLQARREDEKSAELVTGNTVAGLLLKLHEAGLIDPYVLFSLGDDGIAHDYKAYRAANRAKLEEYMDKFVMPASAGK